MGERVLSRRVAAMGYRFFVSVFFEGSRLGGKIGSSLPGAMGEGTARSRDSCGGWCGIGPDPVPYGAMAPTLVLLAAGMSTRFGRLKQLEPVGSGDEALLDFSVYDARKSGFGRVLLIIREEMEDLFRAHIRGRWPKDLDVAFHHQRVDDLAGVRPGRATDSLIDEMVGRRTKPWGTAHALLSAGELLPDPFAILNADDFYGESAFFQAASALTHGLSPGADGCPVFGLMTYILDGTLFNNGGVSRGICRVDKEGWLEGIEEVLGVQKGSNGILGATVPGQGVILNGREPTSTNFWIFTPAIFPLLERAFEAFLGRLMEPLSEPEDGTSAEPEFLIPSEVNRFLAGREARVRVFETEGPFFGITHPEDREWVMKRLGGMLGNGRYPEFLWSKGGGPDGQRHGEG